MQDGETPCFAAAQEGHAEVVTVLAGLGADVNQADTVGRRLGRVGPVKPNVVWLEPELGSGR